MFTFNATASGPDTEYDKSATMTDEAGLAVIGSMKKRFSINGEGQTPTLDEAKQPVLDEDDNPVTHEMTNEEAINFAFGAFFKGWGQCAIEDARERARAELEAALPAAPDWTVL